MSLLLVCEGSLRESVALVTHFQTVFASRGRSPRRQVKTLAVPGGSTASQHTAQQQTGPQCATGCSGGFHRRAAPLLEQGRGGQQGAVTGAGQGRSAKVLGGVRRSVAAGHTAAGKVVGDAEHPFWHTSSHVLYLPEISLYLQYRYIFLV